MFSLKAKSLISLGEQILQKALSFRKGLHMLEIVAISIGSVVAVMTLQLAAKTLLDHIGEEKLRQNVGDFQVRVLKLIAGRL